MVAAAGAAALVAVLAGRVGLQWWITRGVPVLYQRRIEVRAFVEPKCRVGERWIRWGGFVS
jgi:hypothetical protein